MKEHAELFKVVVKNIAGHGFKILLKKCSFVVREFELLGHFVDLQVLRSDPEESGGSFRLQDRPTSRN